MSVFDNYSTEGTSPNNQKENICIDDEYKDYITVNGFCTHTFELPFKYNAKEFKDIKIIYYQEKRENFPLIKEGKDITISAKEDDECFYISCTLNAEETSKFGNTLLNTFVQVKLTYNNEPIYSEKYRIKVYDTIEERKEKK